MRQATQASATEIGKHFRSIPVSARVLRICGLAMGTVLLGAAGLLYADWPFSRQAVLNELQEASQSKVQFASLHGTYFPRPGCVLEHVTFQHNMKPGAPPLISVERLRIEGSFLGLFTRHLKSIRVEGLRILIPAKGTGEGFLTPPRSSVVIDDLIADGARLEVATREPHERPLIFAFNKFGLAAVGSRGPASFRADFSNPEPPGNIVASGKFGPWNEVDVGKTPVSGEYSFQHADLGVYGGIAGLLSSTGKIDGLLTHIGVRGTTDTPAFAVASGSQTAPLETEFQAVVDGTNGDTFLQSVTAKFWRTTIWSEGKIAGGTSDKGKTAAINLAANDGRIEDLLRLFTHSKRAPMSGAVSFEARVLLPPGDESFLKKVVLQGDFGIDEGKFSKPATQMAVKTLSEGARGLKDHPGTDPADDSGNVLSDLRGHLTLKDGMASFSNLSFSVPGAYAQLHGTFNLISEKIDLRGTLKTNSELSKTTHGVKAVMLKVLDPIFKKHPADYVAPVKITGTYNHPAFGLDLMGHDERKPRGKKPGAS